MIDLMSWSFSDLKTLIDIDNHLSDKRFTKVMPDSNKRALNAIDWADEFNTRYKNTEWGIEADYFETLDYFVKEKYKDVAYWISN